MTIELTALLFYCVMTLFTLLLQAIIAINDYGFRYVMGNRDMPPGSESLLVNRLERIVRNTIESGIIFAPLVLIAAEAGISNSLTQWGAITFTAARLVYGFIYAFGIAGIRTLAWNIGVLALFTICFGVFISV